MVASVASSRVLVGLLKQRLVGTLSGILKHCMWDGDPEFCISNMFPSNAEMGFLKSSVLVFHSTCY